MSQIFVNRGDAKEWFNARVKSIPEDGVTFSIFYGPGGQGKTALLDELKRLADAGAYDGVSTALHTAAINFKNRNNRIDPLIFLINIRNGFAGSGLGTPAFDVALDYVWERVRPQDQPKNLAGAWLKNSSGAVGEGVTDTIAIIGQVLGEEIQKIPAAGAAASLSYRWTAGKARKALQRYRKDFLDAFFQHAAEQNEDELSNGLTEILANDLLHALKAKSDHARLVLFLDEYESLFPEIGYFPEQPIDRCLRRFLDYVHRLHLVVGTRDPFLRDEGEDRTPWTAGPFWKVTAADHYSLLGLDRPYIEEWLTAAGVTENSLREIMLESSQTEEAGRETHYPLLIDKCIELLKLYRERGETPPPEVFVLSGGSLDAKLAEIVGQIIKDFSGDRSLRATLNYLFAAGRFDEASVEFLRTERGTGLPMDSFELLTRISFIEAAEDGFWTVHKKIAEVFCGQMSSDAYKERAEVMMDHFLARSQVSDPRAITSAHEALFRAAAEIRFRAHPDGLVSWMSQFANTFRVAARTILLTPLWQETLAICQRVLGEEHPSTATSYNNVASNLNAQGRYEEAEPLYRKGLEISQRVLGEEHPSTATSYNNVASNLDDQGRYEEAEPLYRKGLEISQRVLGEEHPSTATSYNNVASNLDDQGRYEEAEPLYRKGLEISQRVLGEEHPSTATSYNNVAYNLNAQGRYEEAEPLYRKGLEISQRVLGEEHPSTATSYNSVAYNLNAQGRYEEAEPLYRKGLEICQRVLGEEHPDTATSYNNVASNLDDQGRYEEAEPLYRKGLEICQRVLGEEHPSTATSYNNVAYNLNAQGRYEEAEPLYRKGLEICQRVLGEEHPDTATSYNNVASNLDDQGRYEEAEPLYRKGLEISQRVLGEEHPSTATSYNNVAYNLNAQGRYEEAEPLLRKGLEISQRVLGEEHPVTKQLLKNLNIFLSARD